MSNAPSTGPAVSILIVSWNTRDLLHACLTSIAQMTRVPHEVIVVDNASRDGSAEMVRSLHPAVRLVASAENLGFVKGNNLAARHATGEHLLLLNPDTALVTDAVGGLHRLLDAEPRVGAAGCKLLNADGTVQMTCAGTFPSPGNELTSLLFLNRLAPRLFRDRELSGWDHLDDRDVECLSGACIMIRRPLWETLGGFDENIFMYAEDVDLCFRVIEAGWRVRYLASDSIFHFEGSSSNQRSESFYSLVSQMSSNTYFLRKHHGRVRAAAYRLAVFAGASFRLAAGTLGAPLIHAVSGRGAGWFLRKNLALLRWCATGRMPARRAAAN